MIYTQFAQCLRVLVTTDEYVVLFCSVRDECHEIWKLYTLVSGDQKQKWPYVFVEAVTFLVAEGINQEYIFLRSRSIYLVSLQRTLNTNLIME